MHYEYAASVLSRANLAAAQGGSIGDIYRILSTLPLADFCSIIFQPPDTHDALKRAIPGMPSAEMQRRWTGHSGAELLTKSCNILRLLQVCSYHMRAAPVSGTLLDYGCGWGRLTRLLAYFATPDTIYGVDPMRDSLDACRMQRVHGRFSLIPTKPESLPLDGATFDFGVAYSVFTHTPPNVTSAILTCLRRHVSRDGLLACTIRPIEFWNLRRATLGNQGVDHTTTAHRQNGFAFQPVGGGVELDKNEYGDTSMTIEFFSTLAAESGWKVGFVDRDSLEPFQIMVGLSP